MNRRTARAALALAAGLLPGCSREATYEKPLTPVRVVAVQPQGATSGVRYSAAIEPNTRVDLAFKVGGYVRAIEQVRGADGTLRALQEGDRVRRGTVLARVDPSDYEQKVRQARSQLAEATTAATQATQAFERAKQLFATKSLTRPELEAAETNYEVVQAKIGGAQALVQEAENALANCALVAPLDGVVVRRLIELGSLVGPGTPGFIIADTARVKAVFGAPDVMLKDLRIGSSQTVVSEAIPGRLFRGTITRIASVADPSTRAFDVDVTLPNPDGLLRVGMVAALQVAGNQPPLPTLAVPIGAVVRSKAKLDGYAVFVVAEQGGATVAQLREVTLGDPVGNQIEVKAGLQAGDRVIVTGATLVSDGEAVRIAS